jgi:two-component system, OmpR family, sensor histidine kinase ResE
MNRQPTPPEPNREDASSAFRRVHELGTASETLFPRLYNSLTRRNQLQEAQAAVAQVTQQANQAEERSRLLRSALLEKSIEVDRLNAILAGISEGIIMQDNDGRIIMMNSAARDMLGNQGNFWKSELGVLANEYQRMQVSGRELAPLSEARQVNVAGRIFSAQIAAVADHQGERIGTLMIIRDVTQDELSTRLKRSFVTHISHELITPLAPMRVASELLLNTPPDQPANRRMLEMISRNVDILDRMVSEMLDMTAMTSGHFQVRADPLNLEELLWEVVSAFSKDVKDNRLDITVMLRDNEILHVPGDHKHLHWSLSNLLRNAIQYTEPGGHIYIASGLDREQPDRIFIDVADTGVGISTEDLPFVFDLFYRGEARTASGKRIDPRGLGQGLFVARTVAQAHGGELLVDSRLHGGSTFTLLLPRDQQALIAQPS